MINGYVNLPAELSDNFSDRFTEGVSHIPGIYRKVRDIYELRKPVVAHFTQGPVGCITVVTLIAFDNDNSYAIMFNMGGGEFLIFKITDDDNVSISGPG